MRKLMSECLPAGSLELLDRIARLGDEQGCPVYVVGGFVRDLMLGTGNLDIDVVVEGDGLQFARALALLLKADTTPHPRFGTTVLALPEGGHLDVATARSEIYSEPGALPDVQPGTIEEDMARRDFSINSMAIQLRMSEPWTLLDSHNGVCDLENKSIRILHENSFVDDPTRIFRAVRFEQRLGFSIEKETENKLTQALNSGLVDRLSGHRAFNELVSILSEDCVVLCLRRLLALNIFQALETDWMVQENAFHSIEKFLEVREENEFRDVLDGEDNKKILLQALLWFLDEPVLLKILERLDPPGKLKGDILHDREQAIRIIESLSQNPSMEDLELFGLIANATSRAVCWAAVVAPEGQVKELIRRYYRDLKPKGEVFLKGEDLIRMGLNPGPKFQEIFNTLLRARLEGNVTSRQDEEVMVRKLFVKQGGI